MEIFYSFSAQDNPSKFPCLLNLPSTNLEWPASFFTLSLVREGSQFVNQQLPHNMAAPELSAFSLTAQVSHTGFSEAQKEAASLLLT